MASPRTRSAKATAAAAATPEANPEVTNQPVEQDHAANLKLIVEAGPDGIFTPVEVHGPLVKHGFVEINPENVNDAGEVATRATAAGVSEVNPQSQEKAPAMPENLTPAPTVNTATPAAPAAKVSYAVETGVPLPEAGKRGGGRVEMYPFEKLPAPTADAEGKPVFASFFVPGKAAKDFGSVIYGARQRFARTVEGQTRTTRSGKTAPVTELVRDFFAKDVDGGVRVWRTK